MGKGVDGVSGFNLNGCHAGRNRELLAGVDDIGRREIVRCDERSDRDFPPLGDCRHGITGSHGIECLHTAGLLLKSSDTQCIQQRNDAEEISCCCDP